MPAVTGSPGSYWSLSRSPRYSIALALPLLVLYEALAAMLGVAGSGVRNGADVILKSPFVAVAGQWGPLIFVVLLVMVGGWYAIRDLRRARRAGRTALSPRILVLMLVESAVLAVAFGIVVGIATAHLLSSLGVLAMAQVERLGATERLMVSLGAGLYEELLFRVLLVGGLLWLGRRVFGWRNWVAGTVAVLVGALVFSTFHYVGPYGDPFEIRSFAYRAVGGLAFSGLYVVRGFGITAWTHALYDVFLLVL
jgi:hypothetical protein